MSFCRLRNARSSSPAEGLEGDDGAGILNAGDGLHLLVDEMTDIGAFLDIELRQQVELSGGRIDFGGDLGVGEPVGDIVGFAELAFDLDKKRNHRSLPAAASARPQSSKIAPLWQAALAARPWRN